LHSATLYNDTELMNPQRSSYPSNYQSGGNQPSTSNDGNAENSYNSPYSEAPQPPKPAYPAPADPSNTSSSSPKPKKDLSGLKSVFSTILLLAIAPIIAFGITTFGIQSYQVDGESMETTLQNNDRLIVNKTPRTIAPITGRQFVPHRGDIIIFNQGNLPDTPFGESKQLIKRVIALPGERVVVQGGKVFVYNKEHPEGFNPDTATGYKISAKITSTDVDYTIQKDQIFVLGDNRPNSEDSRYFGPIKTDAIVGKLVLRLLPANKAQKF
jgi:signal peptidase I